MKGPTWSRANEHTCIVSSIPWGRHFAKERGVSFRRGSPRAVDDKTSLKRRGEGEGDGWHCTR